MGRTQLTLVWSTPLIDGRRRKRLVSVSNTITDTCFSGRRTNRFAAILPGRDVAARRTHRITVICPGAGHIVIAIKIRPGYFICRFHIGYQ